MKIIQFLCAIILFLCLSTPLSAQRWNLVQRGAIDLVIGADYGFRSFKHLDEVEERLAIIHRRSFIEEPSLNFRIGFNYNHFLSDRWAIKSGLRLINPGFRSGPSVDIREGNEWKIENSQFTPSGYNYRFQYFFLEIPTMIRYIYSLRWCKSYVEAGLSHNLYLHSNIKQQGGDRKESYTGRQNLKPYNVSATMAIGGEMLIERQWSAFVQMGVRYQLTPLRESQIREYFFSLGLETGVRMTF